MTMHKVRNKAAGKDFINGSFILKCIIIEPKSKTANPKAEGCSNSGIHIAATNPIAKPTFRIPTK